MELKKIIDSNLSKFLNSNELSNSNFIIYPYGEGGMITKYLLNTKYGIKEKYIIDNNLCNINKSIKNFDEINVLENYIFLVTSKNPYIISSIKEKEINNWKIINVLDSLETYFIVPEGHFYSPIPDIDEVKKYNTRLFKDIKEEELETEGIELNTSSQLKLVNEFSKFYNQLPFRDKKINTEEEGVRYYYYNNNFEHSSAITLYSIMRYFKPKNIIEIGSGFSSCAMIDINEIFFDNNINCTFIEPYPDLILSLIKEYDNIDLLRSKIQDISVDKFKQLKENDILFIDSSHVAKTGSDVNYILFNILPNLNKGVIIHFHDIFYPFEYPKKWIYEGRAWNEDYILKAFLQYNNKFKIIYWNHFLGKIYPEVIMEKLPLCMKGTLGSSLWIQKY